jgi:hypothetical protein
MSTDPQRPDDNQEAYEPIRQNGSDQGIPPSRPEEARPLKSEELSEGERQHLVELFCRANVAHDLAKDAAFRFCRHSVEAGAALLQAQDLCPKGTWLVWLADYFDGSARTAQRYMQQAKAALPIGGDATNLSYHPSEELPRLFVSAVLRLERQRAVAIAHDEMVDAAEESTRPVQVVSDGPPSLSSSGDPLTTVSALFDELFDALQRAIASGQRLDYGQFVLEELERIRADLEACRLLINDCCVETRRSA